MPPLITKTKFSATEEEVLEDVINRWNISDIEDIILDTDLENTHPVVFDIKMIGVPTSTEDLFLGRHFRVTPVTNPLFAAQAILQGASFQGRSLRFATLDDSFKRFWQNNVPSYALCTIDHRDFYSQVLTTTKSGSKSVALNETLQRRVFGGAFGKAYPIWDAAFDNNSGVGAGANSTAMHRLEKVLGLLNCTWRDYYVGRSQIKRTSLAALSTIRASCSTATLNNPDEVIILTPATSFMIGANHRTRTVIGGYATGGSIARYSTNDRKNHAHKLLTNPDTVNKVVIRNSPAEHISAKLPSFSFFGGSAFQTLDLTLPELFSFVTLLKDLFAATQDPDRSLPNGIPVVGQTEIIENKGTAQVLEDTVIFTRSDIAPGMVKAIISTAALNSSAAGTIAERLFDSVSSHLKYQTNPHQSPLMIELNIPLSETPNLQALVTNTIVDDAIHDGLTIASAPPLIFDPILRPYQAKVSGVHVATTNGFLNACSPGLGKTVTTLRAHRHQWEVVVAAGRPDPWRALIVCSSSLRSQWEAETHKFFPEIHCRIADTLTDIKNFAKWHADAGDDPLQIICSYRFLAEYGERIADEIPFDEIVVDEALFLKNRSTKQTKGAWALRSRIHKAVALTGTPIDKHVVDIFNILAWVQNNKSIDKRLADNLQERFIQNHAAASALLSDYFGPYIVRYDRSEIASDLPAVQTQTVMLDPSKDELRLAALSMVEMKSILDSFIDDIELLHGKKAAQAAAIEARGATLGAISVARQAASDPASLVGSKSVAVQVLQAKGILGKATKAIGTKRTFVEEVVVELADNDESTLIFTDFSTVAHALADSLNLKGVSTGLVIGGQTAKKRDIEIKKFKDGDHKVLVLTSVGESGLNLQETNNLIHYDLPWSAAQIVQRIARAARIGNTNSSLNVLIPIMRGTIEERIVQKILPRAITAATALDFSRGIDVAETEIGQAFAGMGDIDLTDTSGGFQNVLDIAKELFN